MNLTTNLTPFLILGDINARVGEFTHVDEQNYNPHPSRVGKESQRKNCDKSTNSNGMKLNLCKGFEMQIANGGFTGDLWGNFTHHNKNKGASTVDLAIISDNLFPLTVDDLKVLPQTEFSDHCQIILTIGNLRIQPSNGNPRYQWLDRNKQYKWNKDPKSFVKALNSDKVKLSIIHCTQLLEAGLIESSRQNDSENL